MEQQAEGALFVNHTVMDADTCRDFLALSWPKNAGATRWVLLLAGLSAGAYGLWQLVGGTGRLWYAAGMLLMAALALFLACAGWLLRLRRYTLAQQRAWGGPTLEKTVRFYEDGFEQQSRLGSLAFGYGRVTGLRHNRRAILIYMGPQALLVSRGGFEGEGAEAAFLAFMGRKQGKR